MTAIVPDLETIEHLDFTPVCQRMTCAAGNPAATHVSRAVCGCATPICHTCMEFLRSRAEDWCRLVRCTRCGHVAKCRRYGDFFRIEPLP